MCEVTEVSVPVKVLDTTGAPSTQATVVATNSNDGRRETGTTNGAGVYRVTSDLGPGVITVRATLNDLATPVGQFTVTPGECTPSVSPNALVLQLK